MNINGKNRLNALASFKTKIFAYNHDWLMYQSAANEIRLINFYPDASIKEEIHINLPS